MQKAGYVDKPEAGGVPGSLQVLEQKGHGLTELPLMNQYLLKNGFSNPMEMFDLLTNWKYRQLSSQYKD